MKTMLQIVLLMLAVLASMTAPAAAQTTQPAKSATVKDVLAYAPGPALGVIHVDLKNCRSGFMKIFEAGIEGTEEEITRLRKALLKIDTCDVFIIGFQPMLVIRGSLTPRELIDVFGEDHPFKNPMIHEPEKPTDEKNVLSRNGLYIYRRQYCILWGKEYAPLPKDMMIVGFPPNMYHTVVGNIGKGAEKNGNLLELLKNIDPSRQIWGGGIIPNMVPEKENPPQVPRTVVGSANICGKNEAVDAKIVLGSEEAAQELAEEAIGEIGNLLGKSVPIKAVGKSITVSLTGNPKASLVDKIIEVGENAKKGAKRTAAAANLRATGMGLAIYEVSHNDQLPKELGILIDEGNAQPKMFICPLNPKAKEFEAYNQKNFKTYEGQNFKCDLILVKLKENANDTDIHAYFKPEYYKDKNGKIDSIDVLLRNGSIQPMKYDDFQKKLAEQTKAAAK